MTNRRERGKREKLDRIRSAAATLFAERGYAAVTTQDIADLADVASGTLFRYAATKPELFLMVYNDKLSGGIEEGAAADSIAGDPTERTMALLDPFVSLGLLHRENIAVYQRELLFGDPNGLYRAEGLALIERLQSSIASILRGLGEAPGDLTALRPEVDAELAARSIFAILHMELVHAARRDDDPGALPAELRTQIGLVIQGITGPVQQSSSEVRGDDAR